MARRPLIAGNWKMNMDRLSSVELAEALVAKAPKASDSGPEILICPPLVYLDVVEKAVRNTGVALGAQNVYHEDKGAFTGEVSTAMLRDVGCDYVILGHSERRNILGETNEVVNRKLHAVLRAGLSPILCVGELLEQRQAGQTQDVIRSQFEGSFAGVTAEQMMGVVIAYEPVWAIGTGQVATPEQAEEVHADLRKLIASRYNAEVAEAVRIQYGGSVKPDNAATLLAQPNIDGALVGNASLVADSFQAIIAAA
ncbi:MAG: triose-phosphate isomerase [Pirellulaceae bacterium]